MENQILFQLIIKHHTAAKCLEFASSTKDATCKQIALEQYDSLMNDINEASIPDEEKELHFIDWEKHNNAVDHAFATTDYAIAEEQERSRPRNRYHLALHENVSVAL
jgi:hypothetical protein